MTETRIRGQEVVIRIAQGNAPVANVTAIKEFTAQFDLATIEQGYLGETTMRKDDIFNGISGSFTIDAESQDLFTFIRTLQLRAQRDPSTPVQTTRINATGRFTFPNGQTPRLIVQDMKFDAIPISVPSRDAYVNAAFSYKAENARIITT